MLATFTRKGCAMLTVNVALAFVSLSDEQIRYMSPDMVLVAHSIAAEYFLQSIARLVT